MPFADMREFLAALDERGLLCRVTEPVDWDLEIGAIQRVMFDRGGPALLFESVRDSTHPLVTGLVATPERYALALGCEPGLGNIIEHVRTRTSHDAIEPVMVSSGPCQENVIGRDKIDLYKLPVPKWHDSDGGRYLGTLGLVIARDPETGARNVGIYREQIASRNSVGLNATQQVGILLRKHRALGKAMPVATVVGVDPCSLLASTLQARLGDDELAAAGGLLGRPVEMVKCVSQDLEVPATAEFVFEGEILPDAPLVDEGPFGEFAGYYGPATKSPEIRLTAITHRNDPIFQGTLEGAPPSESTMLRLPASSAALADVLKSMRIPGVKDVVMTEMGCVSYMVVVSLEQHHYHGYPRQVMERIWSHDTEGKWVIVVDDDIDVFDRGQIEWALATRVEPHRDIWVTPPNQPGEGLDPAIPLSVRADARAVRTSRIGIDATTKWKNHEFGELCRPRTVDNVLQRWGALGLPPLS